MLDLFVWSGRDSPSIFFNSFFWRYFLFVNNIFLVISPKTGSHSTGQDWWGKVKRLENKGPSVTEEVYLLNPNFDCWKICLYTSLATSVEKASVVLGVKKSQNLWRRYSWRNRCSKMQWFFYHERHNWNFCSLKTAQPQQNYRLFWIHANNYNIY